MGWERSGDSLSTGPIHRSLPSCAWDPSLVEGSKAAFHKGGRSVTRFRRLYQEMNEAPGPMPPGQREFHAVFLVPTEHRSGEAVS